MIEKEILPIILDGRAVLNIDEQSAIQAVNPIIRAMYINQFESWLASPGKYLPWLKREGVNSINIYGKKYLESKSSRSKLASFIASTREYGIKETFIDYRGADEIPFWRLFYKEFTKPEFRIHPITEIEPYIKNASGVKDYTKFFLAINAMKSLTNDFMLIGGCYMGQPSQAGWNEILKKCGRIYLSKYITMKTWNDGKSFNYVADRLNYIAIAARLANKINFPIVYINSLEKFAWGAKNEYQGDLYLKNSFFGSIQDRDIADYNSKASNETKAATDLIGNCIFDSEFALKAHKL